MKTRSPSGLIIPGLKATVRGEVRWQVLDERGVPEVPRNENGFAIAEAGGVAQSNLITNLGMDRMPSQSVFTTNPDSTSHWRRYLRVGTGSVEPAFADVDLGAQVESPSAAFLSFTPDTQTFALDTTDNVWRAVLTTRRTLQMTANRNLTEFGFSNVATAGDLRIRELFRDGGGVPVTVTVLSGKYIKVDHTLTIEIPAPAAGATVVRNIDTYDAGGALVSSVPYTLRYGLTTDVAGGGNIYWARSWDPAFAPLAMYRMRSSIAYERINAGSWTFNDSTGQFDGSDAASYGLGGYVDGTYYRDKAAAWIPGEGAGTMHGYIANSLGTNTAFRPSGVFVHFDSPATYVRGELDLMTVASRSSWARA